MTRQAAAFLAAILLLAGCGKGVSAPPVHDQPINFSILSAETQSSMGPLWQPVLDDLKAQTGLNIKPYFGSNYSVLIEAMRFNQVQAGWFSALPALEAVRRADGEVFARTADPSGLESYQSVLIVRKGSGITLDSVLKCGKRYDFGIGDAKSTSGTLAPMSYLFTPKGIEPTACFKAVRSASHQANLFAVANGVLDVATNNTVGLLFAARENPKLAAKIQVIWTSPPLPESAIVARKSLDPAVKEKLRQFFLTYGTAPGPEGDRQRANLLRLNYGGFRPADNSYLQPIREMEAGQALAEARHIGVGVAKAQAAYDALMAPKGVHPTP